MIRDSRLRDIIDKVENEEQLDTDEAGYLVDVLFRFYDEALDDSSEDDITDDEDDCAA